MQSLRTRLPTRDLYRRLLREASYLPPLCQSFAKDQIRCRFRKHIYDPADSPPTKARLRNAQHALRDMRAANHGTLDNMFRILMMTFGRTGRRRRELIKALLLPEPPADSAELEAQIEAQRLQSQEPFPAKELPPDWLDKWDTEKLEALAKSQAVQVFWSPKPELKNKKLDREENVPEKNIWGRPPAAKLKRSKIRKWYKSLVEKIMPPVGRDEWETLRLLSTGLAEKSLWEMPSRRPLAISPPSFGSQEDSSKPWDWKAYATQAVRHIERGSSRSHKARTGEEGEAPYGLGSPLGLHDYKRARFWKRLYAKIWAMTPVMERAPGAQSSWNIEWGKVNKEVPVATLEQMQFFEGAEATSRPKKRGRWEK